MITGHVWPGNFPTKRHICARRHKGVKRDSGGWGWVRIGAGGCISTQQTQKKAKGWLVGAQDTIVGKYLEGGHVCKDGAVAT